MSDPKATVYGADPHTQAKHQILKAYLERWLPILDNQAQNINRRNQRLLYVDGFAGAGEYDNGLPGSPIIPIDTAMSHSHEFVCRIDILLIEKRPDRVEHLSRVISEKRSKIIGSTRINIIEPVQGDCETEIRKFILECKNKGQSLGPAFFFLDQFGYSSFSMDLVSTILRNDVCEVFSYLNWNMLLPYMTDPNKHAGITKAFGGEEWRSVIDLVGQEKEQRFRQMYMDVLRARGNAKYVYPFAMRDTNHRVIYWLFFCTNNIRGLEEMKKAMWRVDDSGGFEFSDKFATVPGKLFKYAKEQLAEDLLAQLDGRTLTVANIREHTLVNTPAYNYLEALALLEREGHLKAVSPPMARRAGAFKEYPDLQLAIRRLHKEPQGHLFGGS